MTVGEGLLERVAIQGDSPVTEIEAKLVKFRSSTGHEKSGVNMRGPSRKAKYDQVTDSE